MMYEQKKPQIGPVLFAQVCFLTLMQNGKGVIDKSPDYIKEKEQILNYGYGAFGALDINNQRIVVKWLALWGYCVPPAVLERYEAEEAAWLRLAEDGIVL